MSMISRAFVLVLALFVSPSFAVTFGFTNITNNSGVAASLASEFTLDVTESGANVTFTFSNNSTEDAFINQIYWDDNSASLGGFVSIQSGYSSPASPANLPAGNTVGFSADFSVDGNPPAPKNAVNEGETGAFTLSLLSGVSLSDVIAAMFDGTLRLGIHVQGIELYEQDFSESFVSSVPEPSTYLLFALGLISLMLYRKHGLKA